MADKTFRQIPARDLEALKEATSALVNKVGGVKAAAEAIQAPASRVSEAASPFHNERWLSLLHVAELECVAGVPLVTEALAALAGRKLDQMEKAAPTGWAAKLGTIIDACGALEGDMARAMADGELSDAEAKALSRKAIAAAEAITSLQAALAARVRT